MVLEKFYDSKFSNQNSLVLDDGDNELTITRHNLDLEIGGWYLGCVKTRKSHDIPIIPVG